MSRDALKLMVQEQLSILKPFYAVLNNYRVLIFVFR